MNHKISTFKNTLWELIPEFQAGNSKFDGDIIDLKDEHKDTICYQWLKFMPSWQDDYLPVACSDQEQFLDHLYLHSKIETLSMKMRDDIYMSLENRMRSMLLEVYQEYQGAPAEEFPGYARGQ